MSNQDDYIYKQPTKLLAAISQVIERIALDPLGAHFRQGNMLGADNKHWLRAKFLQQYRLFFRCRNQHKTIVVAWVIILSANTQPPVSRTLG
jgi:toxin YhaV